jgi:type IV pilus assembly protein PilP
MRRTTPRRPLRAGALLGSLLLLAGCDSGKI